MNDQDRMLTLIEQAIEELETAFGRVPTPPQIQQWLKERRQVELPLDQVAGNMDIVYDLRENEEQITEAVQEEAADDREPQRPGGMTPEAEIVAQSKDPTEFNELDWHLVSPQANPGKPDSQCELGSCESEATHHVELLSGTLFFGCSTHVDELIKMRVAGKKRKFA